MAKVSARLRAQVLADLHAGEQPAVVAERYGVDPAVVRVWKQRYVTSVTPVVTNVTAQQPTMERQNHEIGTLIIDLLAAKLRASAAIAEAARQPEWLARQSGSELAALGAWLDATAFAIGDRLAHRANRDETGTVER